METTEGRFYNIADASRKLGFSDKRLHHVMRQGGVPRPYIRIGKRYYYRESDLPAIKTAYNKYCENRWTR